MRRSRASEWAASFTGTALVTGAASGIGREVARQLPAASAVFLLDRDEHGLRTVGDDLGKRAVPTLVDLSDEAALAETNSSLVEQLERLGGLDLLVLNAGIGLVGRLADLGDADIDHLLDVNLRAPMVMARALLGAVVARRGRIVLLSSVSGLVGSPGQTVYCATKFGVRGFAEALRAEVAPSGVSVTVAYPSGVRTRMPAHVRRGARVSDEAMDQNQRLADRLLTQEPGVVAAAILDAVGSRRRTALIGRGARLADLVSRISPSLASLVAARVVGRSPTALG